MEKNTYSDQWFQIFMPLQTDELTENDAAFLARQLPLPRYARVLDLCCGYGRHALRLAQRGYRVTGMDRDEIAIGEARKSAQAAGQDVTYIVGDLLQVGEIAGEFDAIINMWQSFSYFDEETNRDLLRQICRKLTPGGRFVIDMYHREYFENHQGANSKEINGITIETKGQMQDNRWHTSLKYNDEHGDLGGDHMEWQLFTPDEFSALATQCGFDTVLACTWSDEKQAPSPDIARMQVVLQKR